jgi:hypothetical protein
MSSLDVLLIAGLVWQVKHQREYHPARTGDWRLLSDSEVEVAREDEENWIEKLPECVVPSSQMVWQCLHCLDLPWEEPWQTLDDVRDHIQHGCVILEYPGAHVSHSKPRHGVEDPEVNRDFVKDFAAPELYATPTLFEASIVTFEE